MSEPRRRILISQSNYIPWKGYFDLINSVEDFVIFDEVQYTRRDWRNRNQIKTANGLLWLTLPVEAKGKFFQRVDEVKLSDQSWREQHWKSLVHNYGRTEGFEEFGEQVRALYEEPAEYLSLLNERFLTAICRILGIETRFHRSSEFPSALGDEPDPSQRLSEICVQIGAKGYLTAPAARNYLEESCFADRGIDVEYYDYNGYPEYRQRFGDFVHTVSILDLLFTEGKNATLFMKSFSAE